MTDEVVVQVKIDSKEAKKRLKEINSAGGDLNAARGNCQRRTRKLSTPHAVFFMPYSLVQLELFSVFPFLLR